jgi:hypothetical protein
MRGSTWLAVLTFWVFAVCPVRARGQCDNSEASATVTGTVTDSAGVPESSAGCSRSVSTDGAS